ncbi:FAD-dependent oxidoreductase [Nocardia sp. NPDC004278]
MTGPQRNSPAAVTARSPHRAPGPALRTPVGPLHWAGAETAIRWAGYMDGAAESGHRVAREIAPALVRSGTR